VEGKRINIPDQLISAISNRNCVFYIGAGFSIDAGIPGGRQIAQELSRILAKNGVASDHAPLHAIAQKFEIKRGRPDLVARISEIVGKAQKKADRRPYELLSKIEPHPVDIVTTNWDKLIEEVSGRDNVTVIVKAADLPKHSTSMANLLKIHGDLDALMQGVITTDDYARAKNENPQLYAMLYSLFRMNTVLFLGYSLEDWDFLEMHETIRGELQKNVNPRYIVTPDADKDAKERFANLGLTHIEAGVRGFLSELLLQLGPTETGPSGVSVAHEKFPDPTSPSVVHKNPFAVFRAEDMSDELWKRELFREPMMYNIFADAVSPGNVVIDGNRGSGKSMILRYMSYPVQRLLGKNPDFVGTYIKLTTPLFITTRRGKEDPQAWFRYFLSYFSLVVTERVVRDLSECMSKKWIEIGADMEAELVGKLTALLPESPYKPCTLVDSADLMYQLRNALAARRSSFETSSDLIEAVIERITRYVPAWRDKAFYILLDEYENLDDDQQRVVNCLIGSRPQKIYYKIATKSLMLVLADAEGKLLEEPGDFTYVNTDRFDFEQERNLQLYPKFIEGIADQRLKVVWNYDNSIRTLLPALGEGFEHGDYSGFKNVATLSSYLPRDFLEMCKDMVFYANPNLITEEKKERLDPISPNLQNTVIKIHADNLLQSLHRIQDEGPRLRTRTRSENAIRLIHSWGKIFRRILEKAQLKTGEKTVSEFIVRDTEELDEEAVQALRDCVDNRVLRPTLKRRLPTSRRELPGDRYELHRLLCARFQLSLARRYPREIHATWLNALLSSSDPEKPIRGIIKRFTDKEEFPKEKLLDGYLDKTPRDDPE
jgi:NAD-dependent SIR2 family protein deacetylase